MEKWYDRIVSSIEMRLRDSVDPEKFRWIRGKVVAGYRYQDGIITMKSDDGRTIWCGVESNDYRKPKDSIGDNTREANKQAMSCKNCANYKGDCGSHFVDGNGHINYEIASNGSFCEGYEETRNKWQVALDLLNEGKPEQIGIQVIREALEYMIARNEQP